MDIILSCYPLSTDTMREFRAHVTPDRALSLASLRSLKLPHLFAELRSIEADRFVVILSAATERVLAPILLLLGSLTRSKAIVTLDLATGEMTQVPRWRAFAGIVFSIWATLAGRWARLQCAVTSLALARSRPLAFGPLRGKRGVYLKSNLMLGTQAGGSVGHVAGVANELFRRDRQTLMLGLEFPPIVDPAMPFQEIDSLAHYGLPRESNQLRFNQHCVVAGKRAMTGKSFDYIYQRMSIANMAGVQLSRRFKVPLILEYNGSEVWVSKNWGLEMAWTALAQRMEDVCLRHAHRIVVVSDALADELVERGVARERIVNYPNCIDPEVFNPDRYRDMVSPIREQHGFAPDDIVCTFLGTFGAWHGADVLATAINRYLSRPLPEGAPRLRFLMIGDGLHGQACREQLAEAIAAGDVVFTGLVPQAVTPAYLAASDAFLSPHVRPADGSRFFGSPTKLFEYMAMARPIIASGLEQIADVLTPSIAVQEAAGREAPAADTLAILTEPGSVDDLVLAFDILRDRPAWRNALGAAARRKVVSAFTWRRHVDEMFASLEMLANG
jgi:glycosyltransferase involved in cell wall biosynthesis